VDSDRQQEEIYTRRGETIKSANQRLAEALKPKQVQEGYEQVTPERQMDRFGSPNPNQDMTPQQGNPIYKTVQPTMQDLIAAQVQYGADTNDPNALNNAVTNRIAYGQQQETREDNQAFRSQEAQLQREQAAQNLQLQIQAANQRGEDTRQMQLQLAQMQDATRRDLASFAAANKPQRQEQIIQTATGPMMLVNGKAVPIMGTDNKPVQAPSSGKTDTNQKAKLPAFESMNYVIGQFRPQLEKISTGGPLGVSGRISSVTNYQEAQRFNNLKEQLSTELRTIFRIPGEGALSDKEQAQYGVQLPDIKYDKATNEQILNDIHTRSSMRVGQSSAPSASGVKKYNPATGKIE